MITGGNSCGFANKNCGSTIDGGSAGSGSGSFSGSGSGLGVGGGVGVGPNVDVGSSGPGSVGGVTCALGDKKCSGSSYTTTGKLFI